MNLSNESLWGRMFEIVGASAWNIDQRLQPIPSLGVHLSNFHSAWSILRGVSWTFLSALMIFSLHWAALKGILILRMVILGAWEPLRFIPHNKSFQSTSDAFAHLIVPLLPIPTLLRKKVWAIRNDYSVGFTKKNAFFFCCCSGDNISDLYYYFLLE